MTLESWFSLNLSLQPSWFKPLYFSAFLCQDNHGENVLVYCIEWNDLRCIWESLYMVCLSYLSVLIKPLDKSLLEQLKLFTLLLQTYKSKNRYIFQNYKSMARQFHCSVWQLEHLALVHFNISAEIN